MTLSNLKYGLEKESEKNEFIRQQLTTRRVPTILQITSELVPHGYWLYTELSDESLKHPIKHKFGFEGKRNNEYDYELRFDSEVILHFL